jgi:SAM-dependent methyltransferase
MSRPKDELASETRAFYKRRQRVDAIKSLEEAKDAYAAYLRYVRRQVRAAGPRPLLLDVGCGTGWTSALIGRAEPAAAVFGVDLGQAFIRRTGPLSFVRADVLGLPFGSASFDIVSCYQFLEHVPRPAAALDEMLRVLKPEGTLIVAGPNLLSPLVPLHGMIRLVFEKPPLRWFLGQRRDLSSPFGNTLPQLIFYFFRNATLLARKALFREAVFMLREPDLREPAHADTDACYLLNPIDVRKHLHHRGLKILRYQDGGRLKLGVFGALKGGTWIVAQKSAESG